VEKTAELTRPAAIHWVDGSDEENAELCAMMVESGTFLKLNQDLWPGCYYARSDASDVARVEARTFVCSLSKDKAGPTNNWEDPVAMRHKLKALFNGCMAARCTCCPSAWVRSARRCRNMGSRSPIRRTWW
jgi:phosphoenolpyruvate carboxykinase (GTP)